MVRLSSVPLLRLSAPIATASCSQGYTSCCGVRDCRPADDFVETVVDGDAVVRLLLDHRWITVPGYYVVQDPATDGRAHFCGELYILGGDPAQVLPGPTCVILPPRST